MDQEKDRAANVVQKRWTAFEMACSNRRKFPSQEFTAFVQASRRYCSQRKLESRRISQECIFVIAVSRVRRNSPILDSISLVIESYKTMKAGAPAGAVAAAP